MSELANKIISALAVLGLVALGLYGLESGISEQSLLFIATAVAGLGGYQVSKSGK